MTCLHFKLTYRDKWNWIGIPVFFVIRTRSLLALTTLDWNPLIPDWYCFVQTELGVEPRLLLSDSAAHLGHWDFYLFIYLFWGVNPKIAPLPTFIQISRKIISGCFFSHLQIPASWRSRALRSAAAAQIWWAEIWCCPVFSASGWLVCWAEKRNGSNLSLCLPNTDTSWTGDVTSGPLS